MPRLLQADRFSTLVSDVRGCVSCSRMAHSHAIGRASVRRGARVLFVAEAPGRRGAAITGVPLTGDEAGRRFAAFLTLAGLARGEVSVTNAVLCNPHDERGHNRTPAATELARCRPFLARTIAIVDPCVVVALGGVALASLRAIAPHALELRRDAGTPAAWSGRTLVALYHPGRRATLHRSQDAQDDDWRRLGEALRRVL
ncbi:MAG TPA: uracil-DNA glycosylase family protein [Dehalococcoidia bacterium]|nr:uracil-DNA glycosylase family protein [Dehalococcoidia bacterium]